MSGSGDRDLDRMVRAAVRRELARARKSEVEDFLDWHSGRMADLAASVAGLRSELLAFKAEGDTRLSRISSRRAGTRRRRGD